MAHLKKHLVTIIAALWAVLCLIVYFFMIGGAKTARDTALITLRDDVLPRISRWGQDGGWGPGGAPVLSHMQPYRERKAERSQMFRNLLREYMRQDELFDENFDRRPDFHTQLANFHAKLLDSLNDLDNHLGPATSPEGMSREEGNLVAMSLEKQERLRSEKSSKTFADLTFLRPSQPGDADQAREMQHRFWISNELVLILSQLRLEGDGKGAAFLDSVRYQPMNESLNGYSREIPFEARLRLEPALYGAFLEKLMTPSEAVTALPGLDGQVAASRAQLLQRKRIKFDITHLILEKHEYPQGLVVQVGPDERGNLPQSRDAQWDAVIEKLGRPMMVLRLFAVAYDWLPVEELAAREYFFATPEQAREWQRSVEPLEQAIAQVLLQRNRVFCPFCQRMHLLDLAQDPLNAPPQVCNTCGRLFPVITQDGQGKNLLLKDETDWYDARIQ